MRRGDERQPPAACSYTRGRAGNPPCAALQKNPRAAARSRRPPSDTPSRESAVRAVSHGGGAAGGGARRVTG